MMPVTAEFYVNGTRADDGDYTVGAFAGDVCRGVGQWKNGRLLISVYGDANEDIRFVAFDNNSEKFYDVAETLVFTTDNQGSWFAPIALTLGSETTGLKQINNGLLVKFGKDCITVNAGGKYINRLSVTNMSGVAVMNMSDLGKGATITTGSLSTGVYIVTMEVEGKTYYEKIVKANK
jgi:hypothetical protein